MTNKDKAIKAIKELIEIRYTKGIAIYCPLCEIFPLCGGCPNDVLSNKLNAGDAGCTNFRTYNTRTKNLKRKRFWEEALPTLEALPSKCFTVNGFRRKDFKFLIDIDNNIANEV